jgi:hypothetical protein
VERTGIEMGYDPSMSVREMAVIVAQAESLGYAMAFFSLCSRDSVTALAAFGLATTRITSPRASSTHENRGCQQELRRIERRLS